PELGGDDLLRRRELLVAQGDRDRVSDAPSVGDPARAAAGTGREVDRDDRDARAGRDVRHLPSAAAVDTGAGAGRRCLRLLVVRGTRCGQGGHQRRRGSRRGDVALLTERLVAVDYDGTITARDLLQQIAFEFGDPEIVGELDRGLDEGTV